MTDMTTAGELQEVKCFTYELYCLELLYNTKKQKVSGRKCWRFGDSWPIHQNFIYQYLICFCASTIAEFYKNHFFDHFGVPFYTASTT